MPAENKQTVQKPEFNTPDAGRAYIAKLFETVLRRHDYRQYISERLAGDFACTLAQHLEEIKAREDALQLLLNERDEQNHSLEQRRQAEQQAGQAAERRIQELTTFELQPPVEPWFYFVECDDPDYSGLFNHESEAQTQANDHGGVVIKLWNVPPTWRPAEQPAPVAVVPPQDEKLMEIVERYPNGDPLEYDAALRQIKQ